MFNPLSIRCSDSYPYIPLNLDRVPDYFNVELDTDVFGSIKKEQFSNYTHQAFQCVIDEPLAQELRKSLDKRRQMRPVIFQA